MLAAQQCCYLLTLKRHSQRRKGMGCCREFLERPVRLENLATLERQQRLSPKMNRSNI
jgi:hypothetical protein